MNQKKRCLLMGAAVMMGLAVSAGGCAQEKPETEESGRKNGAETTEESAAGGSETAQDEEETKMIDFARDWGSILDLPSMEEISEYNMISADRAPYLAGWLDIEPETKFVGYSIDFKADYLPYGTYFGAACIKMDQSSVAQEYDKVYMDGWLSFYAGLQMRKPEEGSSAIMSFWDIFCLDKEGEETTISAKLVYPDNDTEKEFHHEGNGVNYLKDYAWEKGCWYRMLLECSTSEETGHTLVEQWMCNLETDEWTKICCYDTGLTDSCFVGETAVFLENYQEDHSGDIRTAEYKNIRIRLKDTDQWIPIRQVSMNFDHGSGSFCFGADEEQFWMITTGLENRFVQPPEERNTYNVKECLADAPYQK